jgi:hypothetical protein
MSYVLLGYSSSASSGGLKVSREGMGRGEIETVCVVCISAAAPNSAALEAYIMYGRIGSTILNWFCMPFNSL